ncbi:hypothetical protein ACRJ4B_49860 [Streptomyces sp. GTA36]
MSDLNEPCPDDRHEGNQLDITSFSDVDVKRFHCSTCGTEYTVPHEYPTNEEVLKQAWPGTMDT